ncbi:MAG: YHS domain-containing protein [Bacteroidota bacterium]
MVRKTFVVLIALISFSCGGNEAPAAEESAPSEMITEVKYTPEMVVNTKDYTCGMPVTAGISDTCHIDGNAYGFCSKECMNEFKKDPAKVLAQQ